MKIDRSKSKKSSSDVPFDCKLLIEELKLCDEDKLLSVLKRIKTWNCGKCELYHWIDVLDIFDSILEECCRKETPEQWELPVDMPQNAKKRELLLAVISFTSLLIEHSFSRHLYNSIEHLITLLSSTDMQIVLAILNLLFVFSKRSNFFSRISTDKRQSLLARLNYLAQNWGGKEQGFGLAQCCQDLPLSSYPSNATVFNFEFYSSNETSTSADTTNETETKSKGKENSKKTKIVRINLENVHLIDKPVSQIMKEIAKTYNIPSEQQMQIFTQLRLTKNFANYHTRLQCVQARLNALSIMVYCQAMAFHDNYYQLLYNGLIEELVEVLELKNPDLIEMKSASLKTLTSIIHLDRNSKHKVIIESTGANSYHGFLPILVRNCINSLISGNMKEYPLNFVTALFSFLYHLASCETGCEALVQCGIMESLLRVVDWKGPETDHLTFVTRAVRVIDLLTNQFIDMNAFQSNNGLNTFVQRLEHEVNICRAEQPYEIEVPADKINKEKNSLVDDEDFDTETPTSSTAKKDELSETPMEVELEAEAQQRSQSAINKPSTSNSDNNNLQCYPQRAALMKSMLNFLKKAVQCNGFFESVRPLMYGNFPRSLRHIISNAEYYGPSLFLLATDVVSVYVYQEPSLLSVIQDNGLTDVVLHALLVKNVPPTKEVLASLPTVFTSLCLNHRGLEAFVALHPFERLFKVFLQPDYLQAMRRRRSESIGDTATCLGNSMDELMRHQPSLRIDAIGAIIKLLEEICNLGSDPKYICIKASSKSSSEPTPSLRALMETSNRNISASNVNNDSSSSEEDDDFDDDTTTTAETTNNNQALIIPSTSDDSNVSMKFSNRSEQNRQQIPLIDYILNVMRFVDAILSNNSTPDHCREFLNQNGLEPLFKMLKLPNLPLDFPAMPACYSIAGVFKSLLNLAHEKNIFTKGLEKLKEILEKLDPLSQNAKTFNGSLLLEDLINHISTKKSPNAVNFVTPVLQSMAAAHSYIIMFIHICRTGQGDIRSISIDQWGSPLGIEIINFLGSLYITLVWESTLLLGLNDSNSQRYEFVKSQIEKLNSLLKNNSDIDNAMSPMEVDFDDAICINCSNRLDLTDKKSKSAANNAKNPHQKYTKPLLTVASRLGRALAELFGLLVKLCVGSPIRRRSHHSQPLLHLGISQQSIHSKPSQNIAKHLNILLQNSLSWQPSFDTNIPKFRLTFNVCSIGFSSPMLFDDLKYPYHIMLRYFVLDGGQDAFFDCFKMAFDQTLTNDPLPDGLVEFLDSWLLLLEKMTNPQTLFDSPYTFVAPKSNDLSQEEVTFDPVQYLIRTHKKAFPCIMKLWNSKLYKIKCNRAIESLVTIFSHILKGETIIEKHMTSKKTLKNVSANANNPGTSATSSSELGNEQAISSSGNSTGSVSSNWMANPENNLMVQSLIEMGFPRDAAVDAIVHVGINDLFVATDWILQRHHRYFAVANEDEEMIRAIALSLSDSSRDADNYFKNIEDKSKEKAANAEPKEKEKLVNEIPMRKEDLDTFTNNIYPCILKLIDLLPTVVHKCCELLISISKRNGKKWFEDMLMQLIEDIINNVNALNIKTSFVGTVFPSDPSLSMADWHNQLLKLPESLRLNSRIHLLVLLFNEAKSICAKSINNSMLLDNLLELLENASHIMNTGFEKGATISTPKWLALTILLVDLYEKNALVARRRKRFLLDSMHAKRTWKYFDERSGRWSWYTLETSKTIDEAFRSGETFCRIQVNRRKYTINFINMSQVNDETNSCRPVMVFVDYEKNEKDDSNKKTNKVEKEKNEKSGGDTAAVTKEKDEKSKKPKEKKDKDAGQKLIEEEIINDLVEVDFLNSKQLKTIIESAVNLMRLPIDSEASDAIMRLFLRLTRNHENACLFVQKQGISALLKIPRTSSFKGYVNLTTLIIRHVLEDEKTLKITMDKIIRIQNSVTTSIRDMHYWFRYFTPAVCRDVELFKNSAMNAWRINVPYPVNSNRRLNQDEDRASVTLRVVSNKSAEQEVPVPYEVPKLTKDVICELLNMLPVKFAQHLAQKEPEEANKTEDNKDSNKENDVFYTHTILSILAELTKSYHVVAKVICEHTYSIGYSESIVEDCSALSFILDNLLSYSVKVHGDKDCANYSKALFVAIASVPFVNEVHQTLVVEIKNSLNRAVLLPESVEKHAKIQALSTLITNIIETQTPWFQHNQILRQPQFSTNLSPVVKMFVRKNVVTDLAKVIQFLDLSTPLMTATVNSLLKTLEFLSKTLNTPCPYSRPQPSNVIRLPNRPRLMLEGSFPVPIIDLDPSPVPERETMEQDQHSENMNTNDANNEDSSQNNPTASQIPNASNEETAINTLNDSNVDENIENELIFDSSAYDYNSHPRSGTFTSDELRTDDDDDEDQNAMVDVVSDRNEIHDNTINSNCAESTSSEGTESEASEDDSDDVELEEEEEEEEEEDDEEDDDEEGDDGAGSTQDEQEEDDEEDEDDEEHLDDEEFENEDYAIQAILDESSAFRYQTDNNELIFNLEEVLPHVLQVDPRMPSSAYVFPLGHTEDPSFSVSNGHNNHLSANSMIPLHHPLLSRSAENVAASSSVNNGSSASTNPLNNTHLLTSHRTARNPRRALRSYLQTNNNWHIAHFNSRNNPSHILQRLLGSTSPNDLLHSGLRSQNGFSRQELEFRDEFFDLAPLTYTSNSSFQNCSFNSQPSTTSRWIEVSRILDGEYMFDAMLIIKPEIVKHLEKLKEEELREKKKKEEMEVSSETKKASSDNTVAAPNSAALNDDIQAHIEQLTHSVINQVLESNPTVVQSGNNDEENIQPSAVSIISAENLDNDVSVENDHLPPVQINNPEVDSSRMDIVSEEPAPAEEVPMSVNDGPATVIFSNADAYSVELMDQSNQEPEQESQQVQSEEPQPATTNNAEQEQSAASEQQWQLTPPSYRMTAEERAILGDQELPEGVDPSFLAALPENIRQEVIAEQFRLQRLNYLRAQPPASSTPNVNNAEGSSAANNSNATFAEVNPEFLAALPPNIQEEVLAQQRAEQQRLNATNANPETPVDPDSFFRSLPPSLRRQVLADLDDSQVQILPPEFANEARALRREYDIRHRQIHDRLFPSSNALSRIIRSATSARSRYEALGISNWTLARFSFRNGQEGSRFDAGFSRPSRSSSVRSIKGKHLLDYEGLSSILILLFMHDNLISSVRLQRLIKNLCFHPATRQWVIQSLLEIIEKTKECTDHNLFASMDDQIFKSLTQNNFVSWLSITLDSSFGSRTNVFYVGKSNPPSSSSKKSNSSIYTISINPQAAQFVCRNALDILILLAKTFPDQFISHPIVPSLQKNPSASSLNNSSSSVKESQQQPTTEQSPVTAPTPATAAAAASSKVGPSFFEVLMRHDSIHATKKAKSKAPSSSSLAPTFEVNNNSKLHDYTPLSQLLNLLSHPFIKKSPLLTDRLVRLMTHITSALAPESDNRNRTPFPTQILNEIKGRLSEIEKTIAHERLLGLVVDVLSSKTCSEEGLIDSTSLLIKISNLFPKCRSIFYKLLIERARKISEEVHTDINALLIEMRDLFVLEKDNPSHENEHHEKNVKGQTNVQDRYSSTPIIIKAQGNVKHNISGKEVQLPSMSNLISKTSSQFLFLRILKIIMLLREINAKCQKLQKQKENSTETKMEVDHEDKLSSELQLDHLWEKLSDCLSLLSEAPDDHVVLVLQPAVESFFLVHAPEKSKSGTRSENTAAQQTSENQAAAAADSLNIDSQNDGDNRHYQSLPADTQKFLIFAEKHRVVLNQILRQSSVHLANGPFAVLVDHTRILDFDVKRRYFRQELERNDQGTRREDLPVHIRREHVFEDSYRELNRRTSDDWKNRFYIVFEGEEGQDAGGLLREWYTIISREIFNPNYALFTTSPGDRVTYMINSASHCNSNHLSYFRFVGRVISKAIHDNKLLDCYFTRSFYKHILDKTVKYTDMESEDYAFYQGLVFLLEHNVNELGTDLAFSLEVQEFGVTEVRDLVPDGRNKMVTEENKHEYVKLVCQEKMTGSIKKQLNSFLDGFYDIIPKRLISIFNEHELELLISGLPNIDIDDLKANTDYHKYQASSLQIQWFWRALRSFDQADRANFLQFVTGTSKVPLQGFSALEGMNGPQKFQIHMDDRSTDRLPSAHTCFNQLDLPAYETYDKLRLMLLKAIHECSEGFGFA